MFSSTHYFRNLISSNKHGSADAICSVCSANRLVITAAMRHCKKIGKPLLVEATANQVNQFGGYTGMTPADFIAYVKSIAKEQDFDADLIIFGGDHLGPLVWADEHEDFAMEKAEALVSSFASAGFQKIHLDCSMRLGSDPSTLPLSPGTAAERTVRLAKACEDCTSVKAKPVYVIGSEVPIPGGSIAPEDTLAVTTPEDMRRELELFCSAFQRAGLEDAWQRVIAFVVQPGVEFADNQVFLYNRDRARGLVECAAEFEQIAMEGHSTDYQPQECLHAMKQDGVAILKVGPALTFAMRDAMFALEGLERAIYTQEPKEGWSNYSAVLDSAMLKEPKYWKRHYQGSESTLALMRKYSLSDRSRYYMEDAKVKEAERKLFANLQGIALPLGVIAQFFPRQCSEVISGSLKADPKEFVYRQIQYILEGYEG